MTTDVHDDPHPDDAEAERLLGLLGCAMREYASTRDAPEGETYNQQKERLARAREAEKLQWELQDTLRGLYQPVAGVDYDERPPKRTPPNLPFLPLPPSWRTLLHSYYCVDAERSERAKSDAIIVKAGEDALADLDANKRAEGPRLTAMQIFDHHAARDEPLPDFAMLLLVRAWRIDNDSITAQKRQPVVLRGIDAGRSQRDIAVELGLRDTRSVRALRDRAERQDAVLRRHAAGESNTEIGIALGITENEVHVLRTTALYAAVGEGNNLRALRPAVAEALGLLGKDGCWRAEVLKSATSRSRSTETMLTGIRVNGHDYGPRDELPEVDPDTADIQFIWRDQEAPACRGILERDLFREASRVEARRRRDGKPRNDANKVAKAIKADPRKVRRWMARPDWENAVRGHAIWMTSRENTALQAAARVEARRRLRYEHDEVQLAEVINDAVAVAAARTTATGQPVDVHTIQRLMSRRDWNDAVRANMDRLRPEQAKRNLNAVL